MALSAISFLQEAAEDSSAQSNVSESTHWQGDDGFKDEGRSSRRRGQRREKKEGQQGLSTDNSSDAEPGSATSTRHSKDLHIPNGFFKVNGRPERRDRASGDAKEGKEGGWENGMDRQTRQRSHLRSSPHDWARGGSERTGSAKARAQPRVVPLPMPLPSDKGQARADKPAHQPERPASAAAASGHTPSHRADDTRPASAHAGPSPSAAAAAAASAAQDWPQSHAEFASNPLQPIQAHAVPFESRPQPQQITRPQPTKAEAEQLPQERVRATPVEPAAAPVRAELPAPSTAAKSAPPAQAPTPPAASGSITRTPFQAPAAAPAAAMQAPAAAAVAQLTHLPMPAPVRIPQHCSVGQAQPVVPARALPRRPSVESLGSGQLHSAAEQVSRLRKYFMQWELMVCMVKGGYCSPIATAR